VSPKPAGIEGLHPGPAFGEKFNNTPMRRVAFFLQVASVDKVYWHITVSTMSTATAVQSMPDREMFRTLLERLNPDPADILELAVLYADKRDQSAIEGVRAAWTGDWLRRRTVWFERMGKMRTAAEVTKVSPSMRTTAAVHKARHDGRLLGIDVGDRVYFPEFQFSKDGTPAPWVRRLVEAMPDSNTLLQFLAAERPAMKGRSFAQVLREDSDPSVIEGMLGDAGRVALAEAR
jgi:hypothetical protein